MWLLEWHCSFISSMSTHLTSGVVRDPESWTSFSLLNCFPADLSTQYSAISLLGTLIGIPSSCLLWYLTIRALYPTYRLQSSFLLNIASQLSWLKARLKIPCEQNFYGGTDKSNFYQLGLPKLDRQDNRKLPENIRWITVSCKPVAVPASTNWDLASVESPETLKVSKQKNCMSSASTNLCPMLWEYFNHSPLHLFITS